MTDSVCTVTMLSQGHYATSDEVQIVLSPSQKYFTMVCLAIDEERSHPVQTSSFSPSRLRARSWLSFRISLL